jgi:hypothetical protein
MRKLTPLPLLLAALALLPGCSNKRSVEDNILMLNAYTDAAKKSGVEAYGFVFLPLRAGLHTKTEFGSDGHLALFLRFNPGAAASGGKNSFSDAALGVAAATPARGDIENGEKSENAETASLNPETAPGGEP